MNSRSGVKRFMAPGPWITRDLKQCVLASDFDAVVAENERLRAALGRIARADDPFASRVWLIAQAALSPAAGVLTGGPKGV